MVRPTSHSTTLSFKCQSTAVALLCLPAVAGRILWKVLPILPSYRVSRCFLRIGSLDFFRFWHGARNPFIKLCMAEPEFLEKAFFAPKMVNGSKKVKNTGVFLFKGKFGHWFSLNLFYNKICITHVFLHKSYIGKNLVPEHRWN